MKPHDFRNLLALIWGQHGAQQAAARHFNVTDRSVRRWAAGHSPVPPAVADELRALAARAAMPVVPPPPGGTTDEDDRDDDCAEAIKLALAAVVAAAERAGWTRPEILVAILSWIVTDMRARAGDAATRQTLEAAILMLDA